MNMDLRDGIRAHYALLVLIAIFLVLTFFIFKDFFAPLILGAVLASLTFGLYKKIRSALRGRENLSSLVVLLIISLIIIVPVILISVILFGEAFNLFFSAQDFLTTENIQGIDLVRDLETRFRFDISGFLSAQVAPLLKSLGSYISGQIGALFSNAFTLLLGFFIMLVTVFYLLRDGERLGRFMVKTSPLKTEDEVGIFHLFRRVSRAILYGNMVSALAQGFLGGLGFFVFGIASPVLWGAVMAFLALIPLLGPYLIFTPAALYLFFTKGLGITIVFLLYNMVLVSSIDNIIKPKLIGEKVGVHPLITLLAILGGISIFGIIGIIYGPLIVSFLLTLVHMYAKSRKSHAVMPTEENRI